MLRSHGIALLCVTAELASGRVCCLFTSPLFSNDRLRLRRSVLQFGLPVRCASDRPLRRSLEFGVPRRPRYSLRGQDAHGLHLPCLSQLACWECPRSIHANSPYSRREQDAYNPHPLPERIPGLLIPMLGAPLCKLCGLPCDSPGLPLVLDYPGASRGLEGVGSARKVHPRLRATYRTRSPAAATNV